MSCLWLSIVTAGLFLVALGCGPRAEERAPIKDIKWGTSAVGSSGHRALVALATLLNKEMPDYKITALPLPGAILTVKGYAMEELDGYYGADIAFYELANDIKRFEGFKAKMKRQPVQSFWIFTVEVGAGVRAKDKDTFKQWRDLAGQPIFTGPLPWDVRAHLERAFETIGLDFTYTEVDLGMVGSSLEKGDIKAFINYTNAEATTAPWIVETGLTTDWVAVNPSPEEVELLRKAGIAITRVDPKPIYKKTLGVDELVLLPFYYGFHVGLDVPEEDVYRMLVTIEKNIDELVTMDRGFTQLKENMAEFQRRGVASAIDLVPVHPGLAKYMREKGVWDPAWDGRIAKP